MDGLATDGALHDPISLSTVLLFFFSICTARTIIPIPAGGAIFIKDPLSSETRNRWSGLLME